MGFFDKIFGKAPKPRGRYEGYYKMFNGRVPHFSRWGGSLYEMELIRASINAIAVNCSKLKIETRGSARPALQRLLSHGPNQWQTWGQFLSRLATILYVNNTAFIVPVYDEYGEPSGVFPVLPSRCEVVQYAGKPYLKYKFSNGEEAAIELEYCGIMVRMQYESDLFGETNRALEPTMDIIHINNQGIQEGVKNGASYRFMAKMTNFLNTDDLRNERKRFSQENFSSDSDAGGMLLFPSTYSDIRQLENKPFVVSPEQKSIIKADVFDYFGVNEDVLQNKTYGDAWNAFYEGVIEPFAIQLSDVLTKMFFTLREQTAGNQIMATANRLQYMSNADKLSYCIQLMDRGMLSINEARDIWNLMPVENGDRRIIRGEYYDAETKLEVNNDENSNE